MRIIISSISFYPNISGVAISTHSLVKYLGAKGHKVIVITPANSPRNYIEYDKKAGAAIHRLAAIPNPFRKGFYIPYAPKKQIIKIVEQFKPDIIHLHDPTNLAMALIEQAQKNKIPVIITHHFTFEYVLSYLPKAFHELSKLTLRKQLVNLYNRANAIIAPTQIIHTMLKKIGVRRPIFVISNGVDTKRFRALREKSGQKIILYLGRIDKDKSIDVLIEAFAKINTQLDAKLVLAGPGDYYQKIRQLVNQKNLSKHVTFIGAIDHKDRLLVDTIRQSDVFVIPSTIESQSMATMEAMAAGKPIVAAYAQALPELVKHGQNGYLFKPGNSNQLAGYIVKVLTSKRLSRAMGQASRALIARHDLKNCHSKVEQLYQKIV